MHSNSLHFLQWKSECGDFKNFRDCGYTYNPHKFEIPALGFPHRDPVDPCKHLQYIVTIHITAQHRLCFYYAYQLLPDLNSQIEGILSLHPVSPHNVG